MALADIIAVDGLKLSVVVGGALILLMWRVFTLKLDDNEPPVLKPDIPVIGHIVGLMWHSNSFLFKLNKKKPLAACTLPMLNGKMYVLSSPELVSGLLRARTLSFDPYLHAQLTRLVPASKQAMDCYKTHEFESRWVKIVYGKMTGSDLLKMNTTVLTNVFRQLDALPDVVEVPEIFPFVGNMLTVATAAAILGADNPWAHIPGLVDDYWLYETKLPHFVMGPIPSITAPGAYKARHRIHAALVEYYSKGKYDAPDVSNLTKETNALQASNDWSMSDRAAFMLAIIQGALFNTIPTFYWFLMHIHSNPALVAKLRAEVSQVVVEEAPAAAGAGDDGGKRAVSIDISRLEERCPLLVSTFRENQRVIGEGSINRWVLADTVLSDSDGRSYLLKKDNPVQAHQMINHTSPDSWGSKAGEFVPERFLKSGGGPDSELDAPVPRGAYVPFGGGKHLCPGRNFAAMENWGTMVALLLGFDMTGRDGKPVAMSRRLIPALTAGIGKPAPETDLGCKLARRKGWENVTWKVAKPVSRV